MGENSQLEALNKILAEHGYSISISSCGCCGGPWTIITQYSLSIDEITGDVVLGRQAS